MDPSTGKNDQGQGGQKLPLRGMAIWFLLMASVIFTYQLFSQQQQRVETIKENPDFWQLVDQGRIRDAAIVQELSGYAHIEGEMVSVEKGKPSRFLVKIADLKDIEKTLKDKGVNFRVERQNPLLVGVLNWALPLLLFIGLLYFLFVRQMKIAGRGAMNFGKSRARLLTRGKNKVTFEDVAGVTEAREEVQEIVEFLKDPKRFQKLGGRLPKGVLLVGPPGTGKTLLAKAIAGEANVPFFSISGSDFVEMFVGVGASRVRDMFEQGKKNAPCIMFIDEIDSVGRHRFSGMGGGHDEREQTLNALLVEMDGFDTQEGVIIIAATNRPDILDSALLRPGRFDRQIALDMPSMDGRFDILRIHSRRIKLKNEADLRIIARGTPGYSGADLANLINEAALLAARRGVESVELKDLEEARDKVRWGRERRSRVLDDDEKKLTAYHESGHAIVLALVGDAEPVHKVSIIPRGQALGLTMQLPEKDMYTQSRRKLVAMLVGLMGGRAAEELACKDITTGAQNDLKQATRIARMMVCEWGMSRDLGPQNFGNREEFYFHGREMARNQDVSDETARKIDAEVSRLLNEAYDRALQILTENRDKLETMTRLLIERETLDGRDVAEIIKHGCLLTDAERQPPASTSDTPPTASAPATPAGPPHKDAPSLLGPPAPKPSLA